MVTVSESVLVDAPVERTFAFMDDPQNHVAVTPSLVAVENVEPLDNGGKRVDYTYRIAGFDFGGRLVERTHRPHERMVFDMRGDFEGEIDLQFDPVDGGTRLTYTGRYELPGGLLATLLSPPVRWYNGRELRRTLAAVQRRLAGDED